MSQQQFGRYVLIKKIGVGGMAEVHKAKLVGAKGFSKTVAIKITQSHLSSDSNFVHAFEEEAKLASLLNHPNIVQILDFGDEKGIYYLSMEYVWGKDLRTVLNQSKEAGKLIPIEYAGFIISALCQGLDYAHNLSDNENNPLNLVHRDISPQNILISYEGDVKVADFGIAKIATSSQHTQAGLIKGKVSYMSPEQTLGDPLDPRSDLFAVGIVFYELITGKNPFLTQDNILTLDKIRKAEYKSIFESGVKVPDEVEQIIKKCLSKEPDSRYQSAKELLSDLNKYLHRLKPIITREDIGKHMREIFSEEIKKDELERPTETTQITEEKVTKKDVSSSATGSEVRGKKNISGSKWMVTAGIASVLLVIVLFIGIKLFTSSTGKIQIETFPKEAVIELDGKKIADKRPAIVEDLKIGIKHKVEVSAEGYEKWTKTFVLEDEKTRLFEAELVKVQPAEKPAEVEVQVPPPQQVEQPPVEQIVEVEKKSVDLKAAPKPVSPLLAKIEIIAVDAKTLKPVSASITIDKEVKGDAPLTLENLDASRSYAISISQSGFKTVNRKISFSENEKRDLLKLVEVSLVRETGTLKVVSKDGEGPFEIRLDGFFIGKTPLERANLPVGKKFRIVAQAEGYNKFSREFSLDGQELMVLTVAPEKIQAKESQPVRKKMDIPTEDKVIPKESPALVSKPAEKESKPAIPLVKSGESKTGLLSINTKPWSEVFVNGKSIGETPIGKYELHSGEQEIKMVNNLKNLTKVEKITIEPGKELKKFFNLEE